MWWNRGQGRRLRFRIIGRLGICGQRGVRRKLGIRWKLGIRRKPGIRWKLGIRWRFELGRLAERGLILKRQSQQRCTSCSKQHWVGDIERKQHGRFTNSPRSVDGHGGVRCWRRRRFRRHRRASTSLDRTNRSSAVG
jgi:hypothetical protein